MRLRTIVLLAGLLLGVSCTNPVVESTSTPEDQEAPIVTGLFIPFETNWQPADDFEHIDALSREELEKVGVSTLIPTSLPPDATDSTGVLRVEQTFPTDLVYADVSITFNHAGRTLALSLTTQPTGQQPRTCADRANQSGSLWTVVHVRRVQGCTFTNSAGLSFIEWDDGSTWYHIETFMNPSDAIEWIATWKRLP